MQKERAVSMTVSSPVLFQNQRAQFSLRALLSVVTATGMLLGIGGWIGWLRVSGAILTAMQLCQVGVTFWPLVIAVLWWNDANAKIYGWCVFGLALLVLAHLSVTILHIEILRVGSAGFDAEQAKRVLGGTLNWMVPSVAIGTMVALYFGLTARSTLPYLVGCLFAAIGFVGFFWYAQGLASQWPGVSAFVWWL